MSKAAFRELKLKHGGRMRSTLLLAVAALARGLVVELQAEVRQSGDLDVVC